MAMLWRWARGRREYSHITEVVSGGERMVMMRRQPV